jgi:molybdopterin converting factor subunit 1
MRIQVKLFAVARQRAGRDCVEVELPAAATARQLRGALVEQHHSLADVVAHSRLAIDNQYAADETVIRPAAEVALIPPVSGG